MRFVDAVMQAYNIKNDIRYKKGAEESKMAFVNKLLHENIFTVEKIAELAEVSVDFVLNVKGQLTS